MSSTNDQPALTRRQVRDLERAREAGEAITGSISVVSGSPVPSAIPVTSPSSTQAPTSSHAPASWHAPASVQAPASTQGPGSFHAPGSAHTPTRRELRAIRDAEAPVEPAPVPLRAPKPSSARTLSDALSNVADIENGTAHEPPAPREAPRTFTPPVAVDAHDVLPSPRSAGRAPAEATPGASSAPVASSTPTSASAPAPAPAPASASAPDERAPGPRRHGAAVPQASTQTSVQPAPAAQPGPAAQPAPAELAPSETAASLPTPSSALPPSSTPTVFPFALSGSGAGPDDETDERPSEVAPTTASASAPVSTVAAPAEVASTPSPAGDSVAPGQAPAVPAPAAAQAPVAPAPTPAPGAVPTPAAAPAARSIPASLPEATPYVPPVGHWSTQADIDDDTIDSVGSHFGTMTGQQNALILGNDALPDVTGALNATGEVIITGSIDLPRSLAATGSHHAQRIDGSDIDRMMEEGDHESAESDATPVRASRAVSANTSTRAVVLAAGKPKTNRLPIIASICGGVVILVIVGLVVAGFATGTL